MTECRFGSDLQSTQRAQVRKRQWLPIFQRGGTLFATCQTLQISPDAYFFPLAQEIKTGIYVGMHMDWCWSRSGSLWIGMWILLISRRLFLTVPKQHAFRLYVVFIVVGSFCFATFCFWVFADWSFVCSRLRNFGQDPIGAETSYKEWAVGKSTAVRFEVISLFLFLHFNKVLKRLSNIIVERAESSTDL